MGTVGTHLVAIDAKSGHQLWDVPVADYSAGYSLTEAPLIVKDKVVIGVAGGEGYAGVCGRLFGRKRTGNVEAQRFPARANPETRHGPAIRGNAAVPPVG